MTKTHNLFISHSWQYPNAYDSLCNLLNNRDYFYYNNYSVPKDDPVHTNGTDKELTEAIYNRLRLCHVVLILGGVYSTYSKWINKEITIANNKFLIPKPIIGIKPRGQVNVSSVVQDNALKIANWNTESIVTAIRNHSKT
ncbi:TIR domain-containing protein [Flavivirga aquimarina]|uniref:TIR domain-containing protein n=1 Tax=Flavivirga aquimarina TaxID=2027862 RepID=A0ABT8W718_9FLAO|nr:TIR domain-containing protein [Flavivirga aquimarina]MDO5968872.1 TIR domain-containing protein [Flavivirga aquimarina]